MAGESRKSKLRMRLGLTDGVTRVCFLWMTLREDDIHWGRTSEHPQHYSYHQSGLVHHRYDQPIPVLPEQTHLVRPYSKLGHGTSLSGLRGAEPLFAGWVSKHPITMSNLDSMVNQDSVDNMVIADICRTEEPILGFEANLLEPNRRDLISVLDKIQWEAFHVDWKCYILEPDGPPATVRSTIICEYLETSYSPWVSVRMWDGLPPVLADKFAGQSLKGVSIVMPSFGKVVGNDSH